MFRQACRRMVSIQYCLWNLGLVVSLIDHFMFVFHLFFILSAVVAIRNILNKSEDSLKRDSVFTDSTFDNLNMNIEVERHLRICAKGIFKIFPFFKMKESNKILR